MHYIVCILLAVSTLLVRDVVFYFLGYIEYFAPPVAPPVRFYPHIPREPGMYHVFEVYHVLNKKNKISYHNIYI